MTTLVKNGVIVTMNKQEKIIDHGSIIIDNGKIIEIADEDITSIAVEHIIDASDCIVIPGIITAHTHLYGILLRGAALNIRPPNDFAQVLQRVWWPVDEALTIDDAYASALSAGAEMLRCGSTFYADTYSGPNSIKGSLDAIARATIEVGIRGMVAFEITERHNSQEAIDGLEETRSFVDSELYNSYLVNLMVSIHASFTVTDQLIEQAAELARELDVNLTIHTSEGLVDLYHNLERYGERTIERLDRLGALGQNTILAHCVHVNDDELDIMSKRNVAVAHNPMSNMLNGVGVAPVPEMLKRGIRVGLGNDGWIFDPFENMRTAMIIHRLDRRDPSAIGPSDVLKMATIDGAKCYGIDSELGSIEVGKSADLIVIDGTHLPTPLTDSSAIGHIVNSISGRDVRDVIVGGKLVVHNRSIVNIPKSRIVELSRDSARQLWNRLK